MYKFSRVQVGAFPFDHIDNPDPNSPAAHEEVYKQQTGEKWSEVPHIAKAVEKVTGRDTDICCIRCRSVVLVPTKLSNVQQAISNPRSYATVILHISYCDFSMHGHYPETFMPEAAALPCVAAS